MTSVLSVGGSDGQRLEYDAWVCFWLCEESLRSGGAGCSGRDVRCCFRQVDQAGRGRVGLGEIAPFYEGAVRRKPAGRLSANPSHFCFLACFLSSKWTSAIVRAFAQPTTKARVLVGSKI